MANRLKKMLTEEMVRLDPPLLSTPEEVIEYCGNILVENKKAKAGYVKEMIDSYQRFGPYMVMAPGLALPHARPGGNVKEPCISFVKLKEPVCFHHPCNDPVWVVFALGGVSDDGHIELLQDLSSLLAGERMIEKLAALNTYEELEKLMEKGGEKMKVVTVCGMGFGTSLMLLMSVKESGRKYGITVEGEATDLGSYKGKSCDLIVASSEIAKQIEADVPVLAITNLLDKAEIEEKIRPYLNK